MFGIGIPEIIIIGIVLFIFLLPSMRHKKKWPRISSSGITHVSQWLAVIVACAVTEGVKIVLGISLLSIHSLVSISVTSILIYQLMWLSHYWLHRFTLVLWLFLAIPVGVFAHDVYDFIIIFVETKDLRFFSYVFTRWFDQENLIHSFLAFPKAVIHFFDWKYEESLIGVIYKEFWVIQFAIITCFSYFLIEKKTATYTVHPLMLFGEGYGGRNMKEFKTESTRLAAASAVLLGSGFRKKVLEKVKSRYLASSIELGLDYSLLVKVCRYMELRQNIYNVWSALIILGLLIGVAFESSVILLILIIAAVGLHLHKLYAERFRILPYFQKDRFNSDTIGKVFDIDIENDWKQRIPSDDMNVVVYKDFLPFIGAGLELGGWSISVDVARPKKELGGDFKPTAFEVVELYETIESELTKLNLHELEIKDFVFINGSDIPKGSLILPDRFAAPTQIIPREDMASLAKTSDYNKRLYKWIKVRDWGDEIIVSYFLRCVLKGNSLFVELTRFLLTPLDERYRAVDRLPKPTFSYVYTWFIGSLIKAPFSALFSGFSCLGLLQSGLNKMFGLEARAQRKQIKTDPNFNYGVSDSLRAEMSSKQYIHYFQKIDKEMYEKIFDRQILDAIIDFLDAHDIDISDLKDRQSTILNTGIIVQKGDVKAQSLAVGEGARAGIIERFTRGKDRPVQQSQGGKG